jgi:hypothetical protein
MGLLCQVLALMTVITVAVVMIILLAPNDEDME